MTLLEKITHVALIAACIGSLCFMYDARHRSARVSGVARPSVVGTRLTLGDGAWHRTRVNAVIALSSNCHYCAASLPFYRKLSAVHRDLGSQVSIVVVSAEPLEKTKAWLTQEGIAVDNIFQSPLSALGVTGTPTVLLVDADGTVKKAFDGQLTASGEEELLNTVKAQHL